jgi:putative lipoprotein
LRTIRSILLSVGAVVALALPAAAQADAPTVSGTVMLPDGATLDGAAAWTVLVEDTSLADAPAATIGAAAGAVTDPSATEISFEAVYDASAVDEGATYSLNARIVDAAGDLLFVNDMAIPVITAGAPVEGVDVPVVAVSSGSGEPRVIELEADAALRFLQGGEQVAEIPVTPGETVLFRIENTAGFAHNFWIGTDEELMVANGSTDVGIPDWDNGVQELEWVVPDDLTGLRFGCTVPGHYTLMQGDFTITP